MATKPFYLLSLCFLLLDLSTNIDSSLGLISGNVIRHLPGLVEPLPSELETGYISVTSDVELFYYFFKSENNPTEDPILFWFTGGPGVSGLSAIAFEFGPLKFKHVRYNGSLPPLELNPYRWTKVANIVFLDAPVGTGFSYSTNSDGFSTSDTLAATQSYTFIRKWLTDHSEFLANPLYIGGDSYAGMTVPILVQEVSDGITAGNKPLINLKGYLLGNPITDRDLELNSIPEFAYGMGIISRELFESAKNSCEGEYVNADPTNSQCTKDIQAITECIVPLNSEHILYPKCSTTALKLNDMTNDRSLIEMNLSQNPKVKPPILAYIFKHTNGNYNRDSNEEKSSNNIRSPPLAPRFDCKDYDFILSYYWANDDRVQKALNIRKGTFQEWLRLRVFNYVYTWQSRTSYHFSLSKRPYRSLIYSGDHDLEVTYISTETWIKSLNYSISDDWRPWFISGEVAGSTRTYTNNMTFATIKGAGHVALEYKPRECFVMFKRWLSYERL